MYVLINIGVRYNTLQGDIESTYGNDAKVVKDYEEAKKLKESCVKASLKEFRQCNKIWAYKKLEELYDVYEDTPDTADYEIITLKEFIEHREDYGFFIDEEKSNSFEFLCALADLL